MMKYTVEDILSLLDCSYTVMGNTGGKYFTRLSPTLEAESDSLVFINPDKIDKDLWAEKTKAGIVICDNSVNIKEEWLSNKCFIIVEEPRLVILKVGRDLFKKDVEYGMHPTAFVHPEANIHNDTYIGPFSYIGICEIDKGTIIFSNCHIYDNVKIGKEVIINAGCVIGAEGFGYLQNEKGVYDNFPHVGAVIIEDKVEIGANTCIDRGALGNTHIREGVKINNLVHIAHNVVIGKHTLINAHVIVSGSTTIGNYSWVAPGAIVRDGIKIGSNVIVGMGAVVTKDIPNGETWIGNPARPIDKYKISGTNQRSD